MVFVASIYTMCIIHLDTTEIEIATIAASLVPRLSLCVYSVATSG